MESLYDLEGKGFVSVWAGNFSSREEFDKFFEEEIGENDDASAPPNKFAEDIGFGFYDHDFQEADFSDAGSQPLENLLDGFFHSDSYAAEAAERAKNLGITEANAAVVLVDYKYSGQTKTDSPFKFIGTFPYQ
ncbi:MAG TPA: immunity 22 family protein [Pyrinomonadaceae bacterium]|jgi:hypothetical protein